MTGAGVLGVIADGDGGAGDGGAVPLVMHLLSSLNGMMLEHIGGVVSMALLAVADVRLIRHIFTPLDSRMLRSMILPWALYTVTSVFDSGSCGHPHQGATLKGISPIMVDNIKC